MTGRSHNGDPASSTPRAQASEQLGRVASEGALSSAWRAVHKRNAGPGGDGVTIERFARDSKSRLTQLARSLLAGSYRPSLARRFRPAGSDRALGVPAVVDRVVQRSVAEALPSFLTTAFSDSSYAYRPGRSVESAIVAVDRHLHAGRTFFVRTDIEKFFDRIDRALLVETLRASGVAEDLATLVQRMLEVPILEGAGIHDPGAGTMQGSCLSPLLSDVYLREVDAAMESAGFIYLRYADDVLMLGQTAEECADALGLLGERIEALHLRLNLPKTVRGHTGAGFTFLGVRFDSAGRGFTKQAVEALAQRVDEVLTGGAGDLNTAVDLARSWRGWYGRLSCSDITSLPVLLTAAVDAHERECTHELHELVQRRLALSTSVPLAAPLHVTLTQIWAELDSELANQATLLDAMVAARQEATPEGIELIASALAIARDDVPLLAGSRDGVAAMLSRSGRTQMVAALEQLTGKPKSRAPARRLDDEVARLLVQRFSGRLDAYAAEVKDRRHRRLERIEHAINENDIRSHLSGTRRLAIYVARQDQAVRLALLESRVRREVLMPTWLQASQDGASGLPAPSWPDHMSTLVGLAHDDSVAVLRAARRLGLDGLLEDNGYDGRRLWLLFSQPVLLRHARAVLVRLEDEAGKPRDEVIRAHYPHADRYADGYGPALLLPLAVGIKSRPPARFVDAGGREVDPTLALRDAPSIARSRVLELVRRGSARPAGAPTISRALSARLATVPMVAPILRGCSILNAIVDKAQRLGHVEWMEKASLLEVFGHLPDKQGATALRACLGALGEDDRSIQRRLERLLPFPVGCGKLRQRHAALAQESKCTCSFAALPRGAYPTPLLFALAPRDITAWQTRSEPRASTSPRSIRPPRPSRRPPARPATPIPNNSSPPQPGQASARRPSPASTAVVRTARRAAPEVFEAAVRRLVASRRRRDDDPRRDHEIRAAVARLSQLFDALGGDEVLIPTGRLTRHPGDPPQFTIQL